MPAPSLLESSDRGLYCAAGDFHIDPWQAVDRAVVTHAHSDHARPGCRHYLTTVEGERVLRLRIGPDPEVQVLEYGTPLLMNGVKISLHPAGHILGSAQIRVEFQGEVWVVSGDYKVESDPTCTPFEPIACHVFISESTFGLPVYRWPTQADVFSQIDAWWRSNQAEGKASALFGYSLGKAQRLLAGVDRTIGPIYAHGAVAAMNRAYRAGGIDLPETTYAGTAPAGTDWTQALIVAPPSANGTPWLRRFGPISTGFASGWMRIRGARRRRSIDRGFVLSDHADWPGLLSAIRATGAERVLLTHGYTAALGRWLHEQGIGAETLATPYQGERDDSSPGETDAEGADETPPSPEESA